MQKPGVFIRRLPAVEAVDTEASQKLEPERSTKFPIDIAQESITQAAEFTRTS